MKFRKSTMGSLLASAMAIGLAHSAYASDDDTIVVGLQAEPVTFDPTQISDLNTSRVARRLYEGLVGLKYGTYDLEPRLAESWEISEDELEYTFKLRPGVKFHDGTDFNAEAVKYSFERQIDENHPAHGSLTYRGAPSYLGPIDKIEVIDDLTVKITLKNPSGPFLARTVGMTMRIISPTALKKYGDDVGQYPSGTGPYMLEEWEPGIRTTLAVNPDYWGATPEIENLIYIPIVEPAARLSALTTGEIDLTVDVPFDSLESIKENPDVELQLGDSAHVWFVALNTQLSDPPFDNVLVRQAMNYAVDKEGIVKDILQGTASVSSGPLSAAYGALQNTDVKKYPYDPEKARALLAEAGHADGFGNCEFMVPESGSGMQAPIEMGTLIQANLAAVGINCSIQTMEWGAYLKAYREHPQMAQMSWNPPIGDPDIVLNNLLNSSNFPPGWNAGSYKNERVDELVSGAQKISDPDARREMYLEAQTLIAEDAPWIFVNHGSQIVAHTAKLKNFLVSPDFDLIVEYATFEE
ncbi:ABC transporter substrate-binding protein [Aliishimia ponticola]|uniref:ABC transporter substrate-binding protein n=1 Tax=Aliishimia ponticola TaxID=2499833 RepID=A0A4S4N6K7_9RHOB|nr:ABC transporter substrate-binding protein [Aliishimia ponticola]THH34776.1 ABC transporter substrate-binding protein [Aliishimia ponticola]